MNRLTRTIAALTTLACSVAAAHAQCASATFFRTEGSTIRFSRAVNDFQLPFGNEGNYRITSLSARIATNCAPGAEVWFEVYNSDLIGRPATRIAHIKATSLVFTGRTLTIAGLAQAEVVASVTVSSATVIGAAASSRIWVGAYVKDTFSFLERGNAIADSVNAASTRLPMIKASSVASWTSAPSGTCDLAVSLGTKQFCRADLNQDGVINQTDYAIYMQAWLSRNRLADFNRNGFISIEDRTEFFAAYASGCTPVTIAF